MKKIERDDIILALIKIGHKKPDIQKFNMQNMHEYFAELRFWNDKIDFFIGEMMNGRYTGRSKIAIPGSERTDELHNGIQHKVADTSSIDGSHT